MNKGFLNSATKDNRGAPLADAATNPSLKFTLKKVNNVTEVMSTPAPMDAIPLAAVDGENVHVGDQVLTINSHSDVTSAVGVQGSQRGVNLPVSSFANLFNSGNEAKKINFRSLVNDEMVADSDVVLPKSVSDGIRHRYDNTLVGYFIGKNIAFTVVQNYVKNTWGKFGLQKLMKTDEGVFLFKFSSLNGVEKVLERGPWMIRKSPIILTKWSPSLSLKKGEVTKVPVWVKLHGVPVLAYSEDGLSLIATQIGKPIMLDAFTCSMCVDSWGRISFARALIEISSDSPLKNEVVVAVPNDKGEEHTREVVRVEYEWKPPHCDVCKKFGHGSAQCPKCVQEVTSTAPSMKNYHDARKEGQSDGFTQIISRKKKGKNVVEPRSFGGIRLTKPKPNIQWQQKKNVAPNGGSNIASTSNTTKEGDKREDTKVPSPARVNLESVTPLSNTFDVLNAIEEDVCVNSGQNPKVSDSIGNGSLNIGTENEQEKESLLSRLRKVKEVSRSSPRTSMSDSAEESEVEYTPYGPTGISSTGGGFSVDEVDLDCYDGYESQVLDIPNHVREWCDVYDIHLDSRRRK